MFDIVGTVKDGTWKIIKGTVSTAFGGLVDFTVSILNVGDFFDAYRPDTSGGVLDILNQGGSAVWD